MHRFQSSTLNDVAWCMQYPTSSNRHGGKSPSTSPYVQLSCVTSLATLFILRPFDIAELRTPLSDELLPELAWKEEMVCNTKRLYDM